MQRTSRRLEGDQIQEQMQIVMDRLNWDEERAMVYLKNQVAEEIAYDLVVNGEGDKLPAMVQKLYLNKLRPDHHRSQALYLDSNEDKNEIDEIIAMIEEEDKETTDQTQTSCAICNAVIEEGNVCDSCECALDEFMEHADHISGASEKDYEYPDGFWNDLFESSSRGCVVFDGSKLISIGTFETTYRIV